MSYGLASFFQYLKPFLFQELFKAVILSSDILLKIELQNLNHGTRMMLCVCIVIMALLSVVTSIAR